jgi:hypothetical protein
MADYHTYRLLHRIDLLIESHGWMREFMDALQGIVGPLKLYVKCVCVHNFKNVFQKVHIP